MTVDPLRDPRRLAEIAHAESQPFHEVGCSWGVGGRCTCKAIRAEQAQFTHFLCRDHGARDCPAYVPAPRYLVGEQTAREDIGNALQILAGWHYPADAISKDFAAIERLLRHALTQLENPK